MQLSGACSSVGGVGTVGGGRGGGGKSLCSVSRKTSSLVCDNFHGTPSLPDILCKYWSTKIRRVASRYVSYSYNAHCVVSALTAGLAQR